MIPGTAFHCEPIGRCPPSALPAERRSLGRAALVRRREFAAGRHCARAALSRLGMAPGAIAITVGAGRAPAWPGGVVGSISHAGGWAGAVVARRQDYGALGFDMERCGAVLPALYGLILTAREASRLAREDEGTLIFCAKEATYKALHPLVGCPLRFDEVEIAWAGSRAFRIASTQARYSPLCEAARGRLRRAGGFVQCLVYLPGARSAPTAPGEA